MNSIGLSPILRNKVILPPAGKNTLLLEEGFSPPMEKVCNIGPKGISRREKMGYMFLVLAGIISGYFLAAQVETWIRAFVFPFYAIGFVSLLQAKTQVCVYHAWKKTVEKA